jgi:small subunit ribosomal protein S9
MADSTQFNGTGRRKTATARVRIRPGSGQIIINRLAVDVYFDRPTAVMILRQPLQAAEVENKFDVFVTVAGGGKSGQAGAVRHGISRALLEFDSGLRPSSSAPGSSHATHVPRSVISTDRRAPARASSSRSADRTSTSGSDAGRVLRARPSSFLP